MVVDRFFMFGTVVVFVVAGTGRWVRRGIGERRERRRCLQRGQGRYADRVAVLVRGSGPLCGTVGRSVLLRRG